MVKRYNSQLSLGSNKGNSLSINVRVSASDFRVGHVMCGHKVVKNSKGVKRWKKIAPFTPNCWDSINRASKK